jgi:TRAP-type C4-dicarboxylate transport system permease small subunit
MLRFRSFDAFMSVFYYYVGTLVGISIGIFAVAISLDVGLRYFEIGNLPGMQEIIEYVLFAGVFLSAPWVLRLGAHVRVDVIVYALPTRIARTIDQMLDILGLIICVVLVWFGWINLSHAFETGSTQMKYFHVPEWWLLIVFELSFVLLSVEFLSRLIRGPNTPHATEQSGGGF